jgi:hypothetical protein
MFNNIPTLVRSCNSRCRSVLSLDEAADAEMRELEARGGRKQALVVEEPAEAETDSEGRTYSPDGDSPAKRRARDAQVSNDAKSDAAWSKLGATYMIRSAEDYMSQIDEDVAVEAYWSGLLSSLPKDS